MKALLLVALVQVIRGGPSSRDGRDAADSTEPEVVWGDTLTREERDTADSTMTKVVWGDTLTREERDTGDSTMTKVVWGDSLTRNERDAAGPKAFVGDPMARNERETAELAGSKANRNINQAAEVNQKFVETKVFTLFTEKKSISWYTAREKCKALGEDLASALTNAELHQIDQFDLPHGDFLWLGAQLIDKKDPKSGFRWITGESLPTDHPKWADNDWRFDSGDCLCYVNKEFETCKCTIINNDLKNYVCQKQTFL